MKTTVLDLLGCLALVATASLVPGQTATASSAEAKPGHIWMVQEQEWAGTWTMRADGRTFDAYRRHPDGREQRDVIRVEKASGNTVVLFRERVQGRYTGHLSEDGKRIVAGTASWYPAGDTWSAVIE